ncbi:nitrate ABC transporter substrate-binding protein [Halobiforma lacisalsi AJ5]|uniref:Nitrate ABC transporter substrate-binding protein n=1 Tax=Natronobacterium lacisalsi AJ5 TaxID=358396 RepID=M0LC75_NATLA|nr:ABC transporter substrate-binding protein [Halobiforma lacisalsi]APW99074.1 nitrate ABC transporter substrate-binding protein [Halobiforma lacisalsi AJ5]EMA31191.1 nitrate/sulfonate/bicarbonate ABC transporter periplasmic component-like protein [Halobiforma lacisalsi AJ5]
MERERSGRDDRSRSPLERGDGNGDDGTGLSRRSVLETAGVAGAGVGLSAVAGCLGGAVGGSETITVDYHPYYSEAFSALVIRHGELWEKHLPDGYDVEWHAVLQGAPTVNRLISGQTDLGYMGDNPAIIAAANDDTPIRIVGLSGYSMGQQGNLCVVHEDADLESAADLDGREVNVTQGTLSHRFLLTVLEQEDIEVTIRDQDINTIVTNLREGSIDVAFGWEPSMARVVDQASSGRYLFTGADYDEPDLGALVMPDSLIEDRPEVAKGWLKAELEAKHLLATEPDRALDLGMEESELSRDLERETVRTTLYENLEVNPGVDRQRFYTDFSAVGPAQDLLTDTGPEFLLEEAEVIDRTPPSDRYDTNLLSEAADDLESEVDWNPRRAGDRS